MRDFIVITGNREKKTFRADSGEDKIYYSMTAEIGGEVVRLRADDKDKKLLNHLLNQLDIPVTREDGKKVLIDKLLNGEILTDDEKAKLQSYLDGDEA